MKSSFKKFYKIDILLNSQNEPLLKVIIFPNLTFSKISIHLISPNVSQIPALQNFRKFYFFRFIAKKTHPTTMHIIIDLLKNTINTNNKNLKQ